MSYFYGRPNTYDIRPFLLPYPETDEWVAETLDNFFAKHCDEDGNFIPDGSESEPEDTTSDLETPPVPTEPQTGATSGEPQRQIDLHQASGAPKGDPAGKITIVPHKNEADASANFQGDSRTDPPTPRQMDESASKIHH